MSFILKSTNVIIAIMMLSLNFIIVCLVLRMITAMTTNPSMIHIFSLLIVAAVTNLVLLMSDQKMIKRLA